ncbi:phosphoesterase [Halostagnicola larsenii XH-48]|uniref:Phosphoesterase n=1 Tax=Halostagnicola larsenii XH-48 TaxID=797299 RepID=W0JN55_9EURY|nr:2'-5' RNA ligase family protein [Halostagnicola larsenii]AHF98407.1 phosphoesterase [Halostagnicola larsenii XH-48]
MYSVNVPVPGQARQLATELYPSLRAFETIRENHSMVLKRLGDQAHISQLQHRVNRALEGTAPVEARIVGIEYFSDPPLGTAPVVYLAVESPGLESIHRELLDAFDPVDGLEGPEYVPHITLARGGSLEDATQLASRDLEPIEWTVDGLEFWNGTEKVPVSRVPLSM